jgi:hypothetical protein
MKKITEATLNDKLVALAELGGGVWLYNPKAESPQRFFLDNHSNVSHRQIFAEWDGKIEMPICFEFCMFEDMDWNFTIPLVQRLIKESKLQSSFLTVIDTTTTLEQLQDHLLVTMGKFEK